MIKYGNMTMLWLGSFLIFLIDQCSKVWAHLLLDLDKEVLKNDFVSLHKVYNEQYIMGTLDVYSSGIGLKEPWQFQLLYSFFAISLILVIIWVTNQKAIKENNWATEFAKTGLFLITGGILGNWFDRIFREYGVIDFIRVNAFENSILILNVADIIIYLGEGCILFAWIIILFNEMNKKFSRSMSKNKCSLD